MTSTSGPKGGNKKDDDGSKVVRAIMLAVPGFASGVSSIFFAAGRWQIDDTNVRYALAELTGITAIVLMVAALITTRRR